MSSHSILVSLSLNGLTKLTFTTKSVPRVLTEEGMIKCLDVTLHLSGMFNTPDPIGSFTIDVMSGQIRVISMGNELEYIQPKSVRSTRGLVNAGPKCLVHTFSFSIPLYNAKAQLTISVRYMGLSIGQTYNSS